MICAGIVTFNPEIKRLKANLEAIKPQVSKIYVFDNGSKNAKEISRLLTDFDPAEVIWSDDNKGIAAALNSLLKYSRRSGFSQILFLDQDSVASDGMVDILTRHLSDSTAIVCPYILDRNRTTQEEYRRKNLPPIENVQHGAHHGAITSGSLVNIADGIAAGGFDEALFIDYVDFDFDERMLLHGKKIIRTNETYLIHEKGKSEKTPIKLPRRRQGKVQWEPVFRLGYSPQRCYYQTKNRIIYARKYWHHTHFESLIEIPPLMLLSLLFENNKWAKMRAYCQGIRDGLKAKIKPVQE
ncbi:glycosyltransferase [Bifidobacterium choloepi]|uniref:Glycosyltransferase n=1 Tax=Bifidobacterium choloepi TaxID=2614131 RepID=A0A6I5NIZ4_9BIFI|nr:glycosyltransferase [Bifidobacterium choloepi]NEG70353.1 glycosyltransferase [Bifidobacterium choloepi]